MMIRDELLTKSAMDCTDIFYFYSEDEVKKMSMPIQRAWETGKIIIEEANS